MPKAKDILTTGEVAKICNVAPRTVSKWFDSGQLRGYRIPGSKDRRIPRAALIRFMTEHHIPLDGVQSGRTRVLIIDEPGEFTATLKQLLTDRANYDVQIAATLFNAGIICEQHRPHVVFADLHLPDVRSDVLLADVRGNENLELAKLIAMTSKLTEGQCRHLVKTGYDGYLRKPFHIRQAIELIDHLTAVVY